MTVTDDEKEVMKMEEIAMRKGETEFMEIDEALERILVESGMSISAFARKVGYSRQYIYELLKSKENGGARKIQLDTLKRICDATGYGLERLLVEIGYIPSRDIMKPNSVIIVRKGGEISTYHLEERNLALVKGLTNSLAEN